MSMAVDGKVMWEEATMTLPDEENNEVLDTYSLGWARGDSSIIYKTVDDSYTFSGLPNMEPVDKPNLKPFWVKFRSSVEDGGGPKSASSDFMKFKNVIRRKVKTALILMAMFSFSPLRLEMAW